MEEEDLQAKQTLIKSEKHLGSSREGFHYSVSNVLDHLNGVICEAKGF